MLWGTPADSTALLQALAATIIRPKLDDEELLAALTMRSGKPVRTAAEALGALLTWDELQTLKSLFEQHNGLDISFYKRVAQFSQILRACHLKHNRELSVLYSLV